MSDPAAKLCEQARAGDREAASTLVSLYYERIFSWLRRLTGHEEDAADLTQKTFSKAWQALGSYQGRSSFSTWLHGIGHHVGLEVHDASADVPLAAGMVVTIEPGLYIAEENTGIRIEDMLLVTETGAKVLSSALPRSASDVERRMQH